MKRVVPVVMAAMLPISFLTGYWARGGSGTTDPKLSQTALTPKEDSVEAGFARDMSVHHSQAVDMAERMRARSNDKVLQILATDIVLTQQNQIGQFRGWLEQWSLPMSSTKTPMRWMHTTHSEIGGSNITKKDQLDLTKVPIIKAMGNMTGSNLTKTMPGMASRGEVNALSALPLEDAERSFLSLMISHHQGGVAMAEAVLSRSKRPEVVRLAHSIVASQTSEISAMAQLLAARTSGQS